jgi:O-6-methylguanine DNA methyltransferase
MNHLNKFIPKVFKYLKSLPMGKVASYGEVAKKFGIMNPRNVGWILRQNSDPDKVPCYKVVRSDGCLAIGYKFGGPAAQKRRLLADGVKFERDKVTMKF